MMTEKFFVDHYSRRGEMIMASRYYWVDYKGSKEIALFLPEVVEDLTTGEEVFGMWRMTSNPEEVLFINEVQILSGPLLPPQ